MSKVSVIIPAYKVETYIGETVQSVLKQTHQDFEILIIDDGSPDRTADICHQLNDPRIQVIHQENKGVSRARNTGIHSATGEYIALLDGDDLWQPDKLEKHVKHLEESPDVGLSFSWSAFINEHGQPLGIYQMSLVEGITPGYILYRNPIGNGSSPVIRRQVFEAIRFQDPLYPSEDCFFDGQLHNIEDVECWFRIAATTKWQIAGIPEALTLYRVTEQGASANLAKQQESLERMLQRARRYAPDLVNRWENAARAYQLRFQARRAVRSKAASTAVQLSYRSIATYWRILLEEPRRTLMTLAAAHLLWLLPQSFYRQFESIALKLTGASQKRQIKEFES